MFLRMGDYKKRSMKGYISLLQIVNFNPNRNDIIDQYQNKDKAFTGSSVLSDWDVFRLKGNIRRVMDSKRRFKICPKYYSGLNCQTKKSNFLIKQL